MGTIIKMDPQSMAISIIIKLSVIDQSNGTRAINVPLMLAATEQSRHLKLWIDHLLSISSPALKQQQGRERKQQGETERERKREQNRAKREG